MTRKVVAAFSIFSVIFGAAWYVHENTKRIYVEKIEYQKAPGLLNTDTIVPTSFEDDNVFEPFAPREYIRVISQ